MKPAGQTILVLGDVTDIEAVAAMHICAHGIADVNTSGENSNVIVSAGLPASQVYETICAGCDVLLILSGGVLKSELVHRALILCTVSDEDRRVVTINCDRLNFSSSDEE